jgi:hypothetical protein
MNLFFQIYFLGGVISVFLGLLFFTINKDRAKDILIKANEVMSKKIGSYENLNLIDINVFYAGCFLMSWIQVFVLLRAIIPTFYDIKILLLEGLILFFSKTQKNSFFMTNYFIDIHNRIIDKYNEKHGIEDEQNVNQ